MSGRPVRFLAAVTGGWVAARVVLLWPDGTVPDMARAIVSPAAERRAPPVAAATRLHLSAQRAGLRTDADAVPWRAGPPHMPPLHSPKIASRAAPRADEAAPTSPAPAPAHTAATVAGTPPPGADHPPVFRASRWSGSAWAIARPGGRATPFASQLGGSQAGARIGYAVDGARRVAVYARVSAALESRQQEGAIGLDWRPTRLPVHLAIERRIGIAGIRGGTAAGVIGGIGPTPVAAGVRVEGYGQAGVIVRDRAEGFADGSARATRALGPIDLGLGAWGAAQRGAARLDLGPTIGVGVKLGAQTVRVTADWRQRIAGDARPGSGPAVSVGLDF